MISKIAKTLRKAYRKGAITKKDYEIGLEQLKKERHRSYKRISETTYERHERSEKEIVLGEIKIVKGEGRARVVFDTGKEEIPLSFGPER